MPDKVHDYIVASDNASDYADAQAAKLEQSALEDIDELSRSNTGRDVSLWKKFDKETRLTVSDYEAELIPNRGLDWVSGLAGIYAASRTQFFLDNREELIIKPVAYREQVLGDFDLTQEQLVAAGKRGFAIENTPTFETIQEESYDGLEQMRDLTPVQLYGTLLLASAIRPPEQSIANSSARTQRLVSYPAGSTQWKEGTASAVQGEAKRELTAMTRLSLAGITLARVLGEGQLFVWIGEGGKNTCSNCLANFGDVATMDEWISRGRPGAEICKGGDLCRCNLVETQ